MKKYLALALAMLLALGMTSVALADKQSAQEIAKAAADALPADARVVNVYTWEYYIPDEVVDEFSDATGIVINYSTFSDNETMLAKLQASEGQYDLIVCSDYIIETMIQQTEDPSAKPLLEKIDAANLANYGNIDPSYQGQYYDPDDQYSIPYTNTIPLIVYNPDAVDFEIKSYADLWDESLEGKLALIDDIRNIIGITEKKLGMSFNETDPEKLALVKDELMKLKPNVAVLNADTPHNALLSGDAVAGFMFGSQIVYAKGEMPQLVSVYPEEGLGFGIDNYVIPASPPHLDATYIFLNYLLDGEISAEASDYIDYGNCNTAAQEFMTEEFRNTTEVNVPSELVADAEMVRMLDSETTRLYDQMWTEFKR